VLLQPVPRWILWFVAVLAGTLFTLAWWTFHFPLTYCDSPSWAPAYFEHLVGQPPFIGDHDRGWLVPTYFNVLGWLSVRLGTGNLIGCFQATAMALALLWLCRVLLRDAIVAELVLLPALLLSLLRYAVYSQTIFSEPLGLIVSVPVWLVILGQTGSSARTALAGVGTMLLGFIRLDNLYLPLVLVARIVTQLKSCRQRLRQIGILTGAMLATAALIGILHRAPQTAEPQLAEIMIAAEWIRYTVPPQHSVARWLHFDLIDRLLPEVQRRSMHTIYDALPATRKVYRTYPHPGWLTVARLVAYQCVNRPLYVLADRLATLADLYASPHASYEAGYQSWGSYYWPYEWVLTHWSARQLDEAQYSCPEFARAQARFFHEPAVRSEAGLDILLWLHQVGGWYASWLLRPIAYLVVPAAFIIILRRRPLTPMYRWLTIIIAAHLALRAWLVCADERYELPIDILLIAWMTLTFRMTIQAMPTLLASFARRK